MTKEVRLQAIRDAFWKHTDLDNSEFYAIWNGLSEFCDVTKPSPAQIKKVFDLLPQGIIGQGIQWGFDDSEVRDEIYGFVKNNALKIREIMGET